MVFWTLKSFTLPSCDLMDSMKSRGVDHYTSDHNLYTGVGSFYKPGEQHDAQEFLWIS